MQGKLIGLCPSEVTVKCERFHEFAYCNLDKKKISNKLYLITILVYGKNKKGPEGLGNEVVNLKRKHVELEKERVHLIAKNLEKLHELNHLKKVITLLKDIASETNNSAI
jgi:ribosomal protein L29